MISFYCPRKRQGIELAQLPARLAASERRERNVKRNFIEGVLEHLAYQRMLEENQGKTTTEPSCPNQ